MRTIILSVALVLCACRKETPPAPTAEQAEQLNDAEAMLNAMTNNAEGPETNVPGPSNQSN